MALSVDFGVKCVFLCRLWLFYGFWWLYEWAKMGFFDFFVTKHNFSRVHFKRSECSFKEQNTGMVSKFPEKTPLINVLFVRFSVFLS